MRKMPRGDWNAREWEGADTGKRSPFGTPVPPFGEPTGFPAQREHCNGGVGGDVPALRDSSVRLLNSGEFVNSVFRSLPSSLNVPSLGPQQPKFPFF